MSQFFYKKNFPCKLMYANPSIFWRLLKTVNLLIVWIKLGNKCYNSSWLLYEHFIISSSSLWITSLTYLSYLKLICSDNLAGWKNAIIWGYVDFFFQLNLLPPLPLRSQGDKGHLMQLNSNNCYTHTFTSTGAYIYYR